MRRAKQKPATCEWCTYWRPMVVGYGQVACVCQCTESGAKYMMETGAAATCPRQEQRPNERV